MASIPYIDRQNKDRQSAQSDAPQPSEVDRRGTFEKVLDENLTAKESAGLAIPAVLGATTSVPYLSRGAALLGMPKVAAFTGGYALGNAIDNKFGISDKIGETLGPMLAQLQNGRGSQRTGAFTEEEMAAERNRQNEARIARGEAPLLGTAPAPPATTTTAANEAPAGTPGDTAGYDTLGASQDLHKSEEMQTLREENARRAAKGLPDLSAPESVQFLNAVNPETFNPLNAEIDKQDQQIVNNFIAQQQAQGDQGQAEPEGGATPNLQEALAPSGELPFGGGQAPEGALTGSYQAPDGQNMGMFQGQENAPISQQQLDSLSGQMVESGSPFISGGLTDENGQTIPGAAGRPEGMKPFIDKSGKVAFADPETANRMNAAEGQRRQGGQPGSNRGMSVAETKAALGRKFGMDGPVNTEQLFTGNMNAVQGTDFAGNLRSWESEEARQQSLKDSQSAIDKDRADREARMDDRKRRPGESQTERDTRLAESRITRSKSKDGLTASQRRKIYGSGTKEYEMSKAGINPQTGGRFEDEAEDRRRDHAYDDAKIESLSREADPTKLQEVQSQVKALMEGLTKGPDGKTLTQEDLDDMNRKLMLRLLAPSADQYSSPFGVMGGSGDENT
jgi:hypothetical protein